MLGGVHCAELYLTTITDSTVHSSKMFFMGWCVWCDEGGIKTESQILDFRSSCKRMFDNKPYGIKYTPFELCQA